MKLWHHWKDLATGETTCPLCGYLGVHQSVYYPWHQYCYLYPNREFKVQPRRTR